jgi:outer membrane protein assembly factor BamB
MAAFAGEFTGYISDEKCASSSAKAKTAAEWIKPAAFESCVKKCVKDGSAVVFVTEDNHLYKIDADSMSKVMPQLGHKVVVTGKIEGGTITIDSIRN